MLLWSTDQQRAQEQVLELLPMVSEVNAISEELNKHKYVKIILDLSTSLLAPYFVVHTEVPKLDSALMLNWTGVRNKDIKWNLPFDL